MKRKGCSIILINDKREILLLLRDNISTIPYPDMWDIPGGHVETDETPEQCIEREMKEEMDLDIKGFQLFSITEFGDREEYSFWMKANLNIQNIHLTEGQRLKWFSEEETTVTDLACCFNQVVEDFYQKAPFEKNPDSDL